MACPASPEGGFHRYQLAPTGTEFASVCIYCGHARVFKPFEDPNTVWDTNTTSERFGTRVRPVAGEA